MASRCTPLFGERETVRRHARRRSCDQRRQPEASAILPEPAERTRMSRWSAVAHGRGSLSSAARRSSSVSSGSWLEGEPEKSHESEETLSPDEKSGDDDLFEPRSLPGPE